MTNNFKQTDIGLIPEDWDIIRAEALFNRVSDGTHDTPKKLTDGYPLVTSKYIKNGTIDISEVDYFISKEDYLEVNQRSRVDKYDILFSMIGTIGEVAIIKNDPVFSIKNIGLFKSNSFELSEYCFYWYQSPIAKVYINNSVGGSTQKYIPLFKLRDFPIALPKMEERKKIAHVLSKIQQAIETQEQLIKTTQELKKALMQKLFTEGLNGEPQKQSALGGEIGLIPESWEVVEIKNCVEESQT